MSMNAKTWPWNSTSQACQLSYSWRMGQKLLNSRAPIKTNSKKLLLNTWNKRLYYNYFPWNIFIFQLFFFESQIVLCMDWFYFDVAFSKHRSNLILKLNLANKYKNRVKCGSFISFIAYRIMSYHAWSFMRINALCKCL